jgi:hypothetical protein
MTATLYKPTEQSELEKVFQYDPATGFLAWRVKYYRARPGDEAGTVTQQKRVIVTYRGHKLPAENICWALAYGAWPKVPIYFINGDKQDLRLANLSIMGQKTYSQRKDAIAMRRYRQNKKDADIARENAEARLIVEEMRHEYPSISWSAIDRAFRVREPETMPVYVPAHIPKKRTIATVSTFEDGIVELEHHIQRLDLLAQPDPYFPTDVLQRTTGRSVYSVTLAEIRDHVAYDPASGQFALKRPVNLYGFRADKPLLDRPNSPRYLYVNGRKLYAHLLAWFMTYGVWPRHKSIIWRNGNPSNNSLANLAARTDMPTEDTDDQD